jgi:hypothetical protein
MYPAGGRKIVKQLVDHLLAYRRSLTDRSFDDVPLVFVGEGRCVDWTILAGLTQEVEGTPGVKISWELARVHIHDGRRLYLHPIADDDDPQPTSDHLVSAPVQSLELSPVLDERDILAVLVALQGYLKSLTISLTSDTNASALIIFNQAACCALASLSDLSVRIMEQNSSSQTWFPPSGPQWQSPGGPVVWHLRVLVQLLRSMPPSHSLRNLSIVIQADLGYDVAMDAFCRDFEAVSGSLTDLLAQSKFSSLKINVDVQLRPTVLAADATNLPDSADAWGEYRRDRHGWKVVFDKKGLRVPNCAFRKEREKVDRSFAIMHNALMGLGGRVTWTMSSTEMSAACIARGKARVRAEIEKDSVKDASDDTTTDDEDWGRRRWIGFA